MNQKRAFQAFIFFFMILSLVIISCQGTVGFNPFATETPTPTSTSTPSPTPTSTPTATPTQTPSPTPTPLPTGAITEEQPDGSTLFTDYDNAFQLSIPGAWFVLPVTSEDLSQSVEELSQINPDLEQAAAAFAQLDPNVIRVVALNEDTKYIFNGFSTNLIVTAIEDKFMASMPMDFVVGALEETMQQGGVTVVSEGQLASTNTSGVEIGTMEFKQNAPTYLGTTVPVQSKLLLFQSGEKLIMVQLTAPNQFAQEVWPTLEQIKDSIKRTTP